MTLFDDDGAGPNLPALIVGGSFSQAGGVTTHKIARWNGTSWSGFGTGLGNPDVGAVLSLASCDLDGGGPNPPALYAGGLFNTANGAVAEDIARWDGGTWSPLGSGVNNGVWSMSGFDDDGPGPHAAALYACGGFWIAGGISVQGIARWDGASWTSVGGGLGLGIPYAAAVVDLDGAGARAAASPPGRRLLDRGRDGAADLGPPRPRGLERDRLGRDRRRRLRRRSVRQQRLRDVRVRRGWARPQPSRALRRRRFRDGRGRHREPDRTMERLELDRARHRPRRRVG
jgi:hypothetical protein